MPRPENDLAIEQRVREPRRVPALSLVLGYAAMAPAGVLGASLLGPKWGGVATHLVVVWGGAILTFLAGVRRGLSFRTAGGPTIPQIAMTLWLFALGLLALVFYRETTALVLLLAGYASLLVIDPWAARRGEVPPFFGRLRPLQMSIPVVSLTALLVMRLWSRA